MEITDTLKMQKYYEEFVRIAKKKRKTNQKVAVSASGTKYRHGLGVVPHTVNPIPQGNYTVWEYQARDATNIYLKSSANGYVMLTVIGD